MGVDARHVGLPGGGGLYPGHRAGDGGDWRLVRDGARLGGARRAVLFPHGERPLAVEISAREGFIGGKLSRLRG